MIQQIKQKIYENKIYVMAFVGATAVGVYFYWRSRSKKGKKDKGQGCGLLPTIEEIKGDDSEVKEEEGLEKVQNKINDMIDEDSISYEAIKEIYRSCYQLSRGEFKGAAFQSRRERRGLLDKLVEYQKVFARYKMQLEQIHKKHLSAILGSLGIENSKWIVAIDRAQAQHQQWAQDLASLRYEEMSFLRNQNKPSLQVSSLIAILNYRFKVLTQVSTEFKKLFGHLKYGDLKDLAQAWSADMVYAKYFVEEEDIRDSCSKLAAKKKQQLQQYLQNVQVAIEELAKQSLSSESRQEEFY